VDEPQKYTPPPDTIPWWKKCDYGCDAEIVEVEPYATGYCPICKAEHRWGFEDANWFGV